MNCKPDQLAWIKVPSSYSGTGLELLQNHVVRTVCLFSPPPGAVWIVDPPQRVVLKINGIDRQGRPCYPGEYLEADGIPDAWLQPFDPKAASEDEATERELELVS